MSINGHTAGGYANRLYSMLSSLVISLITDSALIIRWHHISQFVEEPLYSAFGNHTANNSFNADYKPETIHRMNARQSWQKSKEIDKLVRTFVPLTKRRIIYDAIEPLFFELCSNPIYYDKFMQYKLVNKATVDAALTKLYDEESACEACMGKDKLNSVLQIGYEVGGNLLNRLWTPKKELRDRIDHYLNSEFKGYYVIGIQLRYHYLDDKKDTRTFIECAESIEKNVIALIGQANFAKSYNGFKWCVFVLVMMNPCFAI